MANNNRRRSSSRTRGELLERDYTDEEGFSWRVLIPRHEIEHPERGIVIGPPSLEGIGLSEDVRKELHNQLWARGIITKEDIRGRHLDITAALQRAYRVDLAKVTEAYLLG